MLMDPRRVAAVPMRLISNYGLLRWSRNLYLVLRGGFLNMEKNVEFVIEFTLYWIWNGLGLFIWNDEFWCLQRHFHRKLWSLGLELVACNLSCAKSNKKEALKKRKYFLSKMFFFYMNLSIFIRNINLNVLGAMQKS